MGDETSIVPHHGGTPVEMLRDLADFLDTLDEFGKNAVMPDGSLLYDALNPSDENAGTMQADVRWLADRLEQNGSEEEHT